MPNLATNQPPRRDDYFDPRARLRRWLERQHRASAKQTAADQLSPEARRSETEATLAPRAGEPTYARDEEHGPTLGRELPAGVYLSVIGGYVWLALVSWLAFGKEGDVALALAIASVLILVMLGLPTIAFALAWSRSRSEGEDWYSFFEKKLDTATGPLPARQAWLQILIVPGALALAATLIGIVYRIVV
jgi:hypothetical protein